MRSVQQLVDRLKPAIFCLSMVLLMLGITFVLVTALTIWFRAPEQVYLYRLAEDKTLVRGGETILYVIGQMRGVASTALALLLAGVMGIIVGRPESLDSART